MTRATASIEQRSNSKVGGEGVNYVDKLKSSSKSVLRFKLFSTCSNNVSCLIKGVISSYIKLV